MNGLIDILEGKTPELTRNYGKCHTPLEEAWRSYASLVRALSPEEATIDEDSIRVMVGIASETCKDDPVIDPVMKIFEVLALARYPIQQASLLGVPQEYWEGARKVLFGSRADYLTGKSMQIPERDVRTVYEQYAKQVGTIENPRAGSFRAIQQRIMPIDEELANTAYLNALIENPERHIREFLEFVKAKQV